MRNSENNTGYSYSYGYRDRGEECPGGEECPTFCAGTTGWAKKTEPV